MFRATWGGKGPCGEAQVKQLKANCYPTCLISYFEKLYFRDHNNIYSQVRFK